MLCVSCDDAFNDAAPKTNINLFNLILDDINNSSAHSVLHIVGVLRWLSFFESYYVLQLL